MGSDPASVAFDTVQSAVSQGADVVIIDTAGRLHNKVNLMNELSKIKRVMQKVFGIAPHERLLVWMDLADKIAFEQAKQFTAATEVTALAVTKLDGTARGGVVIGISDQFQVPVKYIGVGERMEDLQLFNDTAIKSLENEILTEDEKAFNQTVVYGKDTSYGEVISLAKQYPMMGDKQLIIVKEAQDLKLNEEESDLLLKYISNPVESTILVFAHKYKKVDSRKKFVKQLEKSNWLFYSEPVRDYQLAAWIQQQLHVFGIKTAPNISHLLAEYLGNDLSRISNELNKLKLILKPGEELDGKLVELHIGISKDYNVFELQKALE
ncbi:hypothetical protein FQR65_LT16796 [Abscondita terminalis]|nr:hypothetical protein FQR65_LT16796 [Abscondita terminalis]